MPIIDDENQTYDAELSDRFNGHFFSLTNGNITDSEGNLWYVSQEYELANFVALLETNIGIPMGRVVHNSAADSLEIILQPFESMSFGIFAKKNRLKFLNGLWEIFGWGEFNLKNNSITTDVFPAIVSGFYLSCYEHYFATRAKIQWRQIQDTMITCEVTNLDKPLTKPPKLPNMPWSQSNNLRDKGQMLMLEKRSVGWGIDGKSSYVLPCDMINRIIYNSGGYTDTYNKSLDDVWQINGIDNRYVTSIVCVLQSFKQLFIASDVYVFLSENNNWSEIINSHLGPFGLGSVKYIDSSNGIDEFAVELNANAILIIGKLAGLWERANGKQSVCFIDLTDTEFKVKIESLLSYN